MPRTPAQQLDFLREQRVNRQTRDLRIDGEIGSLVKSLKAAARAGDAMEAAWSKVVPPALRNRARPMSLTRGVLSVRAESDGVRFAVDRWLRAGGQAALAKAAGRGIARVRWVR